MTDWLPIKQIAEQVNTGKITAMSLVEKSLSLLNKHADYKAIIVAIEDRARERAEAIDKQVSAGESAGRLAGVPFIAKDNFLTFGSETTAASNILRGFHAPYQASAIERLEAEGAICVAKANLDAFAHGSSTENSDFFTTLNPHDKDRVPGGSSGGSAASVALGMAPFALGTDTGGSIRLPASFCGVVGYKPTYGLVSRSGVVAMGSSLDVIGPLTRTVEDAAIVFDVMAAKDELDATTIDRDELDYSSFSSSSLQGKKVAVIKEYVGEGLDDDVRAAVEQTVTRLKTAGAEVSEISLPSLPLALAVYYIICPAEVSSNLSRYDGQRYGFSSTDAATVDESYEFTREQGFGAEAKRRIMLGTYVLSSGYYDAYYRKAQTVRTKIINEFLAAFADYDILVGPTSATPAFKIGENSHDPLKMYLTDIMTVAVNIAGLPAISVPSGARSSLPIGVQFIAAQTHDRDLLAFAHAYEELSS